MGVGFEHVSVACVLNMSDLEMLLWPESDAHRKLNMLVKHMQNLHVQIQCVVLLVFYRRTNIHTHEIAATAIVNLEKLLWLVFGAHRNSTCGGFGTGGVGVGTNSIYFATSCNKFRTCLTKLYHQ